MRGGPVERDERSVEVENASYRWGYLIVTYAILVSAAWRSWARQEAPWDLFAIVIGGGLVVTLIQARHKILGRRWAAWAAATALIAGLTAAVWAWLWARAR